MQCNLMHAFLDWRPLAFVLEAQPNTGLDDQDGCVLIDEEILTKEEKVVWSNKSDSLARDIQMKANIYKANHL